MISKSDKYQEQVYLRDIIGGYMAELGSINDKTVVVNADLMGTCRTKSFYDKYPERTVNVGIAEADMVSFSAGLAHEGYMPFAFTMAPFMSMRACEQCRDDVAYGNLNVRLIATYAGLSGGISGATHWSMEDCAIMNSIGGMTVLEPSDPYEALSLMRSMIDYVGPIYMRSSIIPVKVLYNSDTEFQIGKAVVVRKGNDGAFICSGVVVQYALKAADKICNKYGKEIRVIDFHTIKPLDTNAVINAATTGNVIVAQDHSVVGGLGYKVAEVIASNRITTNFKILGSPDKFIPMAHGVWASCSNRAMHIRET